MRTSPAALLPAEGPISRARRREVMAAAVAMHAAASASASGWGDHARGPPRGSARPPRRGRASRRQRLIPKQLETAWEAFARGGRRRRRAGSAGRPRRPRSRSARALARERHALAHGDLRDDDLGLADQDASCLARLGRRGRGHRRPRGPAWWYLCHERLAHDATHDELLEDSWTPRAARSASAISTSGSSPACSSTAGSRPQRGRPSRPGRARVGRARSLAWWVPRVRAALERTGAAT